MASTEEQHKDEQKDSKKGEKKEEKLDDKKDERRFAALPPGSVAAIAETIGIEGLQGDIPRLLAEDATYRLRALLQDACQLMRHARRKRLTTEDLNVALRHMDVPPIYGHGGPECPPWRQVKDPVNKEEEINFLEDTEISLPDIACYNLQPLDLGVTTVTANWLVIEGNQKAAGFTQPAGSSVPSRPISEDFRRYYDNVTTAVLSFDHELTKIALNDVRSNASLASLVPHLVQFVAAQIRMQHQAGAQLKLLFLLQALLDNSSLYLRPTPIAESMCESALYSLLEDNQDPQHWVLRDNAARVLANICRLWGDGGLREKQVTQLMEVVNDSTRCLTSHYGAVMALACMGAQVLESTLLPQLTSYWCHVGRHLHAAYPIATQKQGHQVRGALIKACGVYLDYYALSIASVTRTSSSKEEVENNLQLEETTVKVKEEPRTQGHQNKQINHSKQDFVQMYAAMLECFGDSLLCVSPTLNKISAQFTRGQVYDKMEVTVSLGDKDSHRTGEEMLQEFLEVKKDTPIKKEKTEMDLLPLFSPLSDQLSHSLFSVKTGSDVSCSVNRPAKRSREDSSGGSRSKKQRRSGSSGKIRLGDVFDVTAHRKIQLGIKFNILGRSHDFPKSGHHRTPKKLKSVGGGTGLSSRNKAPPLSVYRTCCAKLKPYGKRKIRTKSRTVCTSGNLIL